MTPSPALSLRPRPDWRAAAQHLIDGCAHLPDAASRVELLERLCVALGDELYPALLGVLCTVGERAAPPARRAVASALVEGLRSGRVPSGRRPAWGSSGASSMRSLGPIEYLCAWYAQGGGAQPPSASSFDRAMRSLLSLVGASDEARLMYAQRLMAVADDPLSGTLTRSTRDGLRQLASRWEADAADVQAPVDAFLHALQGGGLQGLATRRFL
ncbi:hypothetical protein [Piscinibacter terrae]|uniref:hypothetical protein n=1 Tax=Piscinibacter terrae TaxID=2496871 RepID=UPI000F596698|nr:hypothetical protein [Albitalea terrae]